jgi:hypothetical protein
MPFFSAQKKTTKNQRKGPNLQSLVQSIEKTLCMLSISFHLFNCNSTSYWIKLKKGKGKKKKKKNTQIRLKPAPRPTIKGAGSVPLRYPRSGQKSKQGELTPHTEPILPCPPPLMMGTKRTRGFRFTYRAPIPFGPYSLCPEMESKSMFIAFTSIGIFPTA